MNYFEEIKSALMKKGAKGSITNATDFKTMGLDSLDLMDMIVLLEEKLNITISDDELMSIKVVGDLLNVIENLKK
ncbi:phosphopantetheine-binding protein [Spiroplasma taiwanense]|uniref:Putative acyl carrier protein n=1 Tax=Spiroplasma taiwanense CT-1 TaxID=1276220 RepID=S5MI53_9MOLU|nr:phosphopantetheine-binding protein [Spiroplasma taiwanense]AGR41570.1 putative acyl carrier protein [Spiroplasma taiwanense CT-1]